MADIPTILFDHRRALGIGAAGEHLVCADLLLAGYPAFLAGQGSPYDIALDLNGRLVRLTVKSVVGPRRRAGRMMAREEYIFVIGRTKRDHRGKTTRRAYSTNDVDLVALVALDIKAIAYLPMSACPTGLNFLAPHGAPSANKFGPKNRPRLLFSDHSLSAALQAMENAGG